MANVQPGLEELQKEARLIKVQSRVAGALALGVLSGGAVFYHAVEHLGWLDAFYFCTVTLASVGYGDIVPKTSAGKLFTIFYILAGIGIIGFFVNIIIKNAGIRGELRRYRHHPERQP